MAVAEFKSRARAQLEGSSPGIFTPSEKCSASGCERRAVSSSRVVTSSALLCRYHGAEPADNWAFITLMLRTHADVVRWMEAAEFCNDRFKWETVLCNQVERECADSKQGKYLPMGRERWAPKLYAARMHCALLGFIEERVRRREAIKPLGD